MSHKDTTPAAETLADNLDEVWEGLSDIQRNALMVVCDAVAPDFARAAAATLLPNTLAILLNGTYVAAPTPLGRAVDQACRPK